SDDLGGDFGEKTTVSGPAFGMAADPAAVASAPLPEQKTAILSDQALAPKTLPSLGPGELPAQPTVILGDGSGPKAPGDPVGPLRVGPEAPTLLGAMAPILPQGVRPAPRPT